MNYRVFLLFGILLLCSCQSALDIELTYIESVIEDHPDSAIIKLKEIDQECINMSFQTICTNNC